MLSEAQKEDVRRMGFFIRLNEEGPKEGIRRLLEWIESVVDAARSEGLGLDLADVELIANYASGAHRRIYQDAAERVLAALEGRK